MITMRHGGGGIDTSELIKNVFAKRFSARSLNCSEDAAIINPRGKLAYTTDSYVVTPLEFLGGDIGKLAVCGTCNDLSMMGAKPYALSVGFILEEGLPIQALERVVDTMAATARAARVKIVTGDTKVVGGNGGMFINTSGIGVFEKRAVHFASAKVGDAVVVSGTLGEHHACILSSRLGIENSIASDAAVLYPIVKALQAANIPLHGMRDITRGGLGTVLFEVAQGSKIGIEIDEAAVPVTSEVSGFCALLGLDPLYMGNEGKMLAIIPQKHAEKAVAIMKTQAAGKNARIIGSIVEGGSVVMRTAIGGKRLIKPLQGEGLPRIC